MRDQDKKREANRHEVYDKEIERERERERERCQMKPKLVDPK